MILEVLEVGGIVFFRWKGYFIGMGEFFVGVSIIGGCGWEEVGLVFGVYRVVGCFGRVVFWFSLGYGVR